MNAIILNIKCDTISQEQLFKKLVTQGGVLFTVNIDHLAELQKQADFYQAYSWADYIVCDSQILYLFYKYFFKYNLTEKISGSDFFSFFYKNLSKTNKLENNKMFLLGSTAETLDKVQNKINTQVGQELVVGSYSPKWGFEKDENECLQIIDLINQSDAEVLAVGLGAPKQEKWIIKYKHKLLKIKIILAVGAALDFESGIKKRAPKWMSNLGLEWLHRLSYEPRRLWKRYLINDPPVLLLILKQKMNKYKNPFDYLPKNNFKE